jgi:Ca2+-binding EF-hand superfamily protein
VGVSTDPAEVRRLFESLDTNKDGRITYDEYAVMFRELVTRWVTMI